MFARDYQHEYLTRDQPTLKRQRGRAYDREIAKAQELGMSIRAMRRATRQPTPSRGIDYADGGIASLTVHHPDPARIAAINAEWADQQIPDADNGDGETNQHPHTQGDS